MCLGGSARGDRDRDMDQGCDPIAAHHRQSRTDRGAIRDEFRQCDSLDGRCQATPEELMRMDPICGQTSDAQKSGSMGPFHSLASRRGRSDIKKGQPKGGPSWA